MTRKKDGTMQRYVGNTLGIGGVKEGSYLTPELIESVAAKVRVGTPVRIACQESGIPRATALMWLNKGGFNLDAPNSGGPRSREWVHPDKAKEPFRTFAEVVGRAQGSARGALMRFAYQSAMQDGDLALKYLKAISPEEFAPAMRGNPNLISISNNNMQAGADAGTGSDGHAVGPPIGRVSFEDYERIQAARADNESEDDVAEAEWREQNDDRQGEHTPTIASATSEPE